MALPALPDKPATLDRVKAGIARLAQWLPTTDEVEDVHEAIRRLSAYLGYVRDNDARAEIDKGQRLAETRLGELLGPPKRTGRGNKSPTASRTLPGHLVQSFREMAKARKLVEKLVAESDGKRLTRAAVLRAIRDHKRSRVKVSSADFRFIHSDVESITSHIEPGSVDAIVTDPPYPKDYLGLFAELSKAASVILKPGGNAFVMSGQSYLPQVIRNLGKHLTYHWTLAYLTPGGQSAQLMQRKVNTFWKPVLWFRNGDLDSEWIGDVCKSNSNDNDKRFHSWGQSESGMSDLLARVTQPGDLVCDPFMGGGTTAVCCAALGRRFVGSDVDKSSIAKAKGRINVR